ncbi:MAG TPA: ATP-dependent DNA helicase RecG [Bacillota bacterium]
MTPVLETPVGRLRGVGPGRARMLERLGIRTVEGLLEHLPRRYEQVGEVRPIAMLLKGGDGLQRVRGRVAVAGGHRPRRGLHVTQVAVQDGSGTLWAVFFNQPYLVERFRPGAEVALTGKPELRFGRLQMQNPQYEIEPEAGGGAGSHFLPVYPATAGLSQKALRALVRQALEVALDAVEEFLPPAMLQRLDLPPRRNALRDIHFPADQEALSAARRRLAFEELFLLQAALLLVRRRYVEDVRGIVQRPDAQALQRFYDGLPFRLTRAQRRVVSDVLSDMAAPRPMHRLVQGDVGSGKTVVAAAAIFNAACNGHQAAMMAPTEILAEQHADNLHGLLGGLGVRVALLTGRLPLKQRERLLERLAAGEIDVVVGTHAVLDENVVFKQLSLAVTDEQHRFGVRQRAILAAKGAAPDVLVMTATPIPRTLTLTLYGDLDVSVIDEMPPGRRPVRTHWLRPSGRARAYRFLARQVAEGRQGYVVCPLVEGSDDGGARAAVDLHDRLVKALPQLRTGLLHGRMSSAEKQEVMRAFRDGDVSVLVATTVIEVGVDVPNATVMLIEDADRFGLAQLHQLRGRVGRGAADSYCLLIAEPRTDEARQRLRVMERTQDGFEIAEQDLRLRGPGEIFGTRQHGLPDLRVADPFRDLKLLELARREARRLIETDPGLRRPEHAALRRRLIRLYADQFRLVMTG